MKDFRDKVTMMCNLKIYIDNLCKASERIDSTITTYLKQITDTEELVVTDKQLK